MSVRQEPLQERYLMVTYVTSDDDHRLAVRALVFLGRVHLEIYVLIDLTASLVSGLSI